MTKEHPFSKNRLIVVLVILVLVLSSLSVLLYAKNNLSAGEISSLNMEKDNLNFQISSLTKDKEELSKVKTDLETTVEAQKNEMVSLRNQYDEVNAKLGRIRSSYVGWQGYLLSYSTWNLNYTTRRVFSDGELQALQNLLTNKILSNPEDVWKSYQEIYYWISKNIWYASDEPFPNSPSFQDLENGQVSNEVVFDSIMAPSETLRIMQGDCDDQVALTIAMLKSYNRYIIGKGYPQWLIAVIFNDSKGHMATLIPSKDQDGYIKLTILDTVGKYLTSHYGSILSNDPLQELLHYSNRTSSGIKEITIYHVEDNFLHIVKSGSIGDVADFINSSRYSIDI